mmetsp:Transcript_2743/g.10558  ORF Transcript_2743/g.10558 Transcript_2743/m.10558 type:complete len:91 (-) Transcript_2743:114-386(-)
MSLEEEIMNNDTFDDCIDSALLSSVVNLEGTGEDHSEERTDTIVIEGEFNGRAFDAQVTVHYSGEISGHSGELTQVHEYFEKTVERIQYK